MTALRTVLLIASCVVTLCGCRNDMVASAAGLTSGVDDFVGAWNTKAGCFNHAKIGHPGGQEHAKENGHYQFVKVDPTTIGIKVDSDFAGIYKSDWDKCQLKYKANAKGWDKRWKKTFDCQRPPGQWDYLENTCTFTHAGKKVDHEIMVWLVVDSELHKKTAPVIFLTHKKDAGLHAGYLH